MRQHLTHHGASNRERSVLARNAEWITGPGLIRLDGRQHTTTHERASVQIKSLLPNTGESFFQFAHRARMVPPPPGTPGGRSLFGPGGARRNSLVRSDWVAQHVARGVGRYELPTYFVQRATIVIGDSYDVALRPAHTRYFLM